MPYTKKEDRERIEENEDGYGALKNLVERMKSEGDFNYAITRLCHLYIRKVGKKYSTLNTVIGVLECAKQELYRKIISPYEEIKEQENVKIEDL